MKKVTAIMGMDVSKGTLDCHLYEQQKSLSAVSNSSSGFKTIRNWLRKELKSINGLLVVMEYTGLYTYRIEHFLEEQKIQFVKRPALDIKRSLGMVRGKSDKVDAKFISKYGWMRKDELEPMLPLDDIQMELHQLMSHRDKLVADRASYQARLKEVTAQMGDRASQKITASMQYVIEVLTQEIKEAEAAVKELMKQDEGLQKNYQLASSVTGIGFASAVHLLIATENFSRFSTARKLICYCGSAPFEHSSGTSVRGKTRVSHLANKKLKSLLTMAALSAIQHDPELKAKYEQKINEGKAKMCVLNIIRAKLIERVFSVIKKQKLYEIRTAA
jgi:transposase